MERKSAYMVLELKNGKARSYLRIKHNNFFRDFEYENTNDVLINIENIYKKEELKIIACMICNIDKDEKLMTKLWLDHDIVPYFKKIKKEIATEEFEKYAKKIRDDFDENHCNLIKVKNSKVCVHDFLVDIETYNSMYDEHVVNLFENIIADFKKDKIKMAFINSTTQGGGVALMRHALIRFFNLYDLNIGWYNVKGDKKVFEITKKKFHNVLQGVYSKGFELSNEDKKLYNDWTKENFEEFKDFFKRHDVIVIDDPQPSGLIPYIKKENPNCRIIYRSHIQIDTTLVDKKGEVAYDTWNFIYNNVKHCDLFIPHPIEHFVPANVDRKKVIHMPATTDPFDGLNKKLSENDMRYYFDIFNKILEETGQKPMSFDDEYFVQIARFDPSKGIPDVLESYKLLREKLNKKGVKKYPKLVLAGNGAHDDPEGMIIFNKVLLILRQEEFIDIADDIKVAIIPFRDQILNTILSKSYALMQLSHKEGFEIKVTEGLMESKPVIVYNSGGIPLQVLNEENGFVIEKGDIGKVSDKMLELWIDKKLYKDMVLATSLYYREFLTMPNAMKWLYMANMLHNEKKVETLDNMIKRK